MKDNRLITAEVLKANGFQDITSENDLMMNSEIYHIKDYSVWRYSTVNEDGDNCLNLVFHKGRTNNEAEWNLHIDNSDCDSIGDADISYVWQANKFLEIFKSNFKIK